MSIDLLLHQYKETSEELDSIAEEILPIVKEYVDKRNSEDPEWPDEAYRSDSGDLEVIHIGGDRIEMRYYANWSYCGRCDFTFSFSENELF